MTPIQVLQEVFHYPSFRSPQEEIIAAVMAGHDVLAILPTGRGKSLCFQIPGLLLGGTTIVISPLISLMKDQVDRLLSLQIPATYINSSLPTEEKQLRLTQAAQGNYRFIYVAPESLLSPIVSLHLRQANIKLVVIDEAHCISMWGHDFRPEYTHLKQFWQQLPSAPRIMAVTATATQAVRTEIGDILDRPQMLSFVTSFARDNLRIWVKRNTTHTQQLIDLLRILRKHQQQTGIIYTLTRSASEEIAELLQSYGYQALAYHGGMNHQQRDHIQEQFLADQVQIIAATNAFGMGVDKPNIRFVIHYQPSLTLENYYQEVGRAGRDGQISDTYYLFLASDQVIAESLLPQKSDKTYRFHQSKWQKMQQFVNSHHCRRQYLLAYFDEHTSDRCGQCDVCRTIQWDPPESENLRYYQLATLRDRVACQYGLQPFQVMSNQAVRFAAIQCPHKPSDLLRLPGIGQGWLQEWGSTFAAYCRSQT